MDLTTHDIDEKIAALSAQKSSFATDLEAARQRCEGLNHEKDALRSLALRSCDANAKRKLIELRQAIAVTQLSITDITDEITAVEGEIAQLQQDRIDAVRREAWGEFCREAAKIEDATTLFRTTIDEFFTGLESHCKALQKLNALLNRAGVDAKRFDMQNFKRAFDERARIEFGKYFGMTGRSFPRGSVYEKSYDEILSAKIQGIKARHAGETVAEVEDQELAVNE